jgi:hypothetical protein
MSLTNAFYKRIKARLEAMEDSGDSKLFGKVEITYNLDPEAALKIPRWPQIQLYDAGGAHDVTNTVIAREFRITIFNISPRDTVGTHASFNIQDLTEAVRQELAYGDTDEVIFFNSDAQGPKQATEAGIMVYSQTLSFSCVIDTLYEPPED